MSVAAFQNKSFQVSGDRKYPLSSLEWGGSIDTEAQDKLQEKPSTYIKGLGLTTISFEVQLRSDFGVSVRTEIEEWEAIRDACKPDLFILGDRPLGRNKWLLKTVQASDTLMDGDGFLLRATLKLDFEEYVRAGSAKASTSAAAGTTSVLTPDASIYSPTDKADQKRDNQSALRLQRQKELIE